MPEEFVPSDPPPFKPRPDPTSWLTDPQCRDQYVARFGTKTEISWANLTGEEPTKVYGGEREEVGNKVWCEKYVRWSPQGTYLATFHPQGIRLWGGTHFEPQGRFMHPDVEMIDFSPCENFLVTYRHTQVAHLNPAEAIIIWDVRSGQKIRCYELKNPLNPKFQVEAQVVEEKMVKKGEGKELKMFDKIIRGRVEEYKEDAHGGRFKIIEGDRVWEDVPVDKVVPKMEPNRLKWSPDGQYLARLGCDLIQVYQMPSPGKEFGLLDKRSLSATNVLEFAWSPRSTMISYWSPAVGNHPALINIVRLPGREDICSRKLFDVLDGRMVWQNEGEYLCVYMTKIQGKKKTHVLMFFRVKEDEVPVEQIELTDSIQSVTWEPSGDRFAIVCGEARSSTISFYSMSGISSKAGSKGKKELSLLFTLTSSQANEVVWSPAGGIAALVYYAPDSCQFELHDVENNTQLAVRRHDRSNRLVWDPSGRVIASCTLSEFRNAASRPNPEDGINIYSFQGNVVSQIRREKLFQFDWRPRPRDLLSPEEKKAVIKNLKKYEKSFDKEDRQRRQELNQEVQENRRRQALEFYSRLSKNRSANLPLKKQRVAMRNGYDSDDDKNYTIVKVVEETVLSSKEVLL